MKTGPHSFTDPTGQEWHIRGISRVCGPGYVDAWSSDGKAVTVRPVAYLAAAGLTIPADDGPTNPVQGDEPSYAVNAGDPIIRWKGKDLLGPVVEGQGIPDGYCYTCTKELDPSGACFECDGPMVEVEPGQWVPTSAL